MTTSTPAAASSTSSSVPPAAVAAAAAAPVAPKKSGIHPFFAAHIPTNDPFAKPAVTATQPKTYRETCAAGLASLKTLGWNLGASTFNAVRHPITTSFSVLSGTTSMVTNGATTILSTTASSVRHPVITAQEQADMVCGTGGDVKEVNGRQQLISTLSKLNAVLGNVVTNSDTVIGNGFAGFKAVKSNDEATLKTTQGMLEQLFPEVAAKLSKLASWMKAYDGHKPPTKEVLADMEVRAPKTFPALKAELDRNSAKDEARRADHKSLLDTWNAAVTSFVKASGLVQIASILRAFAPKVAETLAWTKSADENSKQWTNGALRTLTGVLSKGTFDKTTYAPANGVTSEKLLQEIATALGTAPAASRLSLARAPVATKDAVAAYAATVEKQKAAYVAFANQVDSKVTSLREEAAKPAAALLGADLPDAIKASTTELLGAVVKDRQTGMTNFANQLGEVKLNLDGQVAVASSTSVVLKNAFPLMAELADLVVRMYQMAATLSNIRTSEGERAKHADALKTQKPLFDALSKRIQEARAQHAKVVDALRPEQERRAPAQGLAKQVAETMDEALEMLAGVSQAVTDELNGLYKDLNDSMKPQISSTFNKDRSAVGSVGVVGTLASLVTGSTPTHVASPFAIASK